MYGSSIFVLLSVVLTIIMALLGLIPYMGLLVLSVAIVAIASMYVKIIANKNHKIYSKHNTTGRDIARFLLDSEGLTHVNIVRANGFLGEYYDPKNKVVAISEELANSTSITSTAVIAHEVGHAIQHHTESYIPIKIRSFLIGISRFVQAGAMIVLFISIFSSGSMYIDYLIGALSLSIIIQLFTLPVEFNASIRALKLLNKYNLLTEKEKPKAKSVLKAAAYTYVAGLLSSIIQLIRLLLIRGDRD